MCFREVVDSTFGNKLSDSKNTNDMYHAISFVYNSPREVIYIDGNNVLHTHTHMNI